MQPTSTVFAAARGGLSDNRGWGLGLSVFTQRDDIASVSGRFGWDGGLGSSGYIDPREGLVGVLMTQRAWKSPVAPPVMRDFPDLRVPGH